MRKFYAFLLACAFCFASAQNSLDAQEQQVSNGTLSFINFFETAETDASFTPIRFETKIDQLLAKAQSENLPDGTLEEQPQNGGETSDNAAEAGETLTGEASAENNETEETPLPEKQKIAIEYPEENALVQKFLKQYTTDYAKKWLAAVMKNGAPYRGYIRAKIAEMGLPECLEFLPVIESNFKIDAVSKSGAMGMWQFMKNSIAPFGIRINERMD